MERLTTKIPSNCSFVWGVKCPVGRLPTTQAAIDRLAAYEDMMERWGFQDIVEVERIFRRVNALGGTDKMAKYKETVDKIVHCGECKHLYFKDMSAYCPHRVGPCRANGFCDYGESREADT